MQTIDLTRDQIVTLLNNAGVEHEEFQGYIDGDDISEAEEIARALAGAHPGHGLSFAWECNTDGDIHMASVGLYLARPNLYLTEAIDRKNVTEDREAKGTDAAVAYATALIYSHNRAIRIATEHGLA